MNLEELKQALMEVQSKLDDDTFLVVEKECVEVYTKSGGFIPTPCVNEDYT